MNDRFSFLVDDNFEKRLDAEVSFGPLELKPFYLLSKWAEPGTKTKRISVAVVLPSGVPKCSFYAHVADRGPFLEITVTWPAPLIDVDDKLKLLLFAPYGRGDENFENSIPSMLASKTH